MKRGRSVSRKRSIRGKSNHGSILRQPCRYHLKGTCTRSPCEYWHPTECQFYKTETGCNAGDKCLFPHHKVDEQPNKKPKNGYYSHNEEKATTRMQWLLWKLYHNWVASRKTRICVMMSHTTLAQVFVRVISSMCYAPGCVFDLSSTLSSHSSFVSPIFHFILLNFDFHLSSSMWTLPELALWPITPLTGYEPNFFDDYHFSDTTKFSPRGQPATRYLVLAWHGDQWRHHRQSALFTTVHSGARRASQRQAYHSLEEKVCCQVSRRPSVM